MDLGLFFNNFAYPILFTAFLLFIMGLQSAVLNRSNFIKILIAVEVMFLALHIGFVTLATMYGITGVVFSMFIMAVTTAEMAIGLSVIIVYFRKKGEINTENMDSLRG